ncbi:hypothetical protein L596_007836 [Steinernema carpocapsae]|uniref:Fungal lipase-type domain-containing protein n=1 Tax=Steinernema carpocapsae TaxID=34508 RepID=A0A4U5PBL8_STECR|nr:hypothetical protein L596_007836 [Steinernema carpocapsae]
MLVFASSPMVRWGEMRTVLSVLIVVVAVQFAIPVPPQKKSYPSPSPYFNWTHNFSLELAHLAFDHAAAAYSPTPKPCLEPYGSKLIKRVAIPCDRVWDECWAFVSLSKEWIVVSFRGTVNRLQLTIEILDDVLFPKSSFEAGGAVVHYFSAAFSTVWPELNATIADLKEVYPNRSLLFTGHSLGGALASLASTQFAFDHKDSVNSSELLLVTFGQPRVGNMDYSVAHDRLVPNSWRIVHAKDLVAHIPSCYISLWSRKCSSYHNHATYHHGTEIWFPDDMSPGSMFRICTGRPTNEDSNCSDAYYYNMNITEHIFYFDVHVSEYGINGCRNVSRTLSMRGNRTPKFKEDGF